eukprot:2602452-Rhodomonas_salina.3
MAAAMLRSSRSVCLAVICFVLHISASTPTYVGYGSNLASLSSRGGFNHGNLRLRGGGLFGMGEGKKKQEVAVPEPQPAAEAPPAQPTQPAQPPQQSLAQHAYEYALAGSMDGIRSGFGQCVGTEVRDLFTKVVHRGAWVGGLAFAQSLGRLPFLKKNKSAQCPQNGAQAEGGAQNGQSQPAGTGVCVCFVTAPTQTVAGALARRLVESGAAACVNEIDDADIAGGWAGVRAGEVDLRSIPPRIPRIRSAVCGSDAKHAAPGVGRQGAAGQRGAAHHQDAPGESSIRALRVQSAAPKPCSRSRTGIGRAGAGPRDPSAGQRGSSASGPGGHRGECRAGAARVSPVGLQLDGPPAPGQSTSASHRSALSWWHLVLIHTFLRIHMVLPVYPSSH